MQAPHPAPYDAVMTATPSERVRRRSQPAILAALLAAGLAGAACAREPSDRVQGYVEGEFVYVAAPLSGELEQLAVARGQHVARGELLFALESGAERAERDAAERRLAEGRAELEDARKGKRPSELEALEAQLLQARATRAFAEQEFNRQEGLAESGGTSITEVDRARSARDQQTARVAELEADLATAGLGEREDQIASAEQRVKVLEAELARAEWDLAEKRQTAAHDAPVFDTLYREGEWVAAGRPVVVLLPPASVKVRAFVAQARAAALHPGDGVRVFVDGVAEPFAGRVTYVSPQVEYTPPVIYSRESREKLVVMVEASFEDGTASRLHPGQPVDVAFGP